MLESLMVSLLAGLRTAAGPTTMRWQFLAAACGAGLAGFVFLALAVDLELATVLSQAAAAAVTAALLILLALALFGVATLVSRSQSAKRAERRRQGLTVDNILELVSLVSTVSEKLEIDLRASAKPVVIGALIAGCALGYSSTLQKLLRNFLRR